MYWQAGRLRAYFKAKSITMLALESEMVWKNVK